MVKALEETLSVKILHYLSQARYFWGYYVKIKIKNLTPLCTYLNHPKFNDNFAFASHFNTLYLFNFSI